MSALLQDLPELPCDFTRLRDLARQDECTALAALLVAVLTVAEQAIRVSKAEPSRALRYE